MSKPSSDLEDTDFEDDFDDEFDEKEDQMFNPKLPAKFVNV